MRDEHERRFDAPDQRDEIVDRPALIARSLGLISVKACVPIQTSVPSAGASAMNAAEMLPPAPGRLSMMIACGRASSPCGRRSPARRDRSRRPGASPDDETDRR